MKGRQENCKRIGNQEKGTVFMNLERHGLFLWVFDVYIFLVCVFFFLLFFVLNQSNANGFLSH